MIPWDVVIKGWVACSGCGQTSPEVYVSDCDDVKVPVEDAAVKAGFVKAEDGWLCPDCQVTPKRDQPGGRAMFV